MDQALEVHPAFVECTAQFLHLEIGSLPSQTTRQGLRFEQFTLQSLELALHLDLIRCQVSPPSPVLHLLGLGRVHMRLNVHGNRPFPEADPWRDKFIHAPFAMEFAITPVARAPHQLNGRIQLIPRHGIRLLPLHRSSLQVARKLPLRLFLGWRQKHPFKMKGLSTQGTFF